MPAPHFDRSAVSTLRPRILRVALLCGGPSAEREISLQSGASVLRALQSLGHSVVQIDPAAQDLAKIDWAPFDVAFIALHGQFGEDGQVQQVLEQALVPYTGSGVAASQLAFSKSAAKERFAQRHVRTAPFVLIHESDSADRIAQQAQHLGFPLVVKPDTQGSSLGVSIIHQGADLSAAVARCFEYDSFGLLEQAIIGTEWTVGLIDEKVLPPIRIGTDRHFFDYSAKYEDDETRYEFGDDVPAEQIEKIANAARSACAALGTCGLARVDLIVDQSGDPCVLEVNTIPGLTDHSLVPKGAARLGWTMSDLCQACLNSALRHAYQKAALGSGRG